MADKSAGRRITKRSNVWTDSSNPAEPEGAAQRKVFQMGIGWRGYACGSGLLVEGANSRPRWWLWRTCGAGQCCR